MSNPSNTYIEHCGLIERLRGRVDDALKLDVQDPTYAGIVKDSVNAYVIAVDKLATFHSVQVVAPNCTTTKPLKDAV